MTPLQTLSRWKAAVPAVGAVLAALSGLEALSVGRERPTLALINESPSLARGLYVRTGEKLSPGAIVAVPQTEAARPYLERLGMPADLLLLKRVVALGGERVCAADEGVMAPGRRAPRLERDRRGMDLPAWRECRALEPDELFLLGDTPGSFDSRYFGPVRRSDVVGVYREVLTW
ncbi:MAG: S26 family signal peptidase [Brevundimonas sp.]|jgi:type IV secretory pathway protease TraF|uniref:S26 family signal peptidase n=1 Tax=Brevundimonas sp. TaxID=1871086 RepID=UPI0025BBB449|nr:S26 family signal peptidase [Brevundimonas sp.]MCH4267313.1 S26 family signal peptidase [Brevundimonas sp.]